MCKENQIARRSLVGSVLSNRCPRCREGKLFMNANPYALKTTMKMPEHCAACGQPYELQTGFYFGTGYVSYGLSVMMTIFSFLLWYLAIGISVNDNRLFIWLGVNTVLLVTLQPVLQRLSRSIWIACFVRYDARWQRAYK